MGSTQRRTSLEVTELILEIASRQHGVVSREQLLEAGLGSSLIQERLAARRLIHLYRGTYAAGNTEISQRAWWTAAVLAGGPCAALSHRSAAALWGVLPTPNDVEILRSSSPDKPNSKLARMGKRPQLTIHRSRTSGPDEYETRDGIRVTSVARTILDISPGLSTRRLESVITEGERLHIVRIKPLKEAAMRGRGWPGSRKLREVLDGWDPRSLDARSDLELAFVAMCREYGLDLPELNVWVAGFLVDGFWPTQKFVVELDSHRHHRSTWQFNRDLQHTIAIEEAGYRVIRLNWLMVTRDAEETASILKRRLAKGPGTSHPGPAD